MEQDYELPLHEIELLKSKSLNELKSMLDKADDYREDFIKGIIQEIKLRTGEELQKPNNSEYHLELNDTQVQYIKEQSTDDLINLIQNKTGQDFDFLTGVAVELESRTGDSYLPIEYDENNEEKESKPPLYKLLIPSRSNIVTPILVWLNVIVFVLMIVTGVDAILPSTEDILAWGGNYRPSTFDNGQWRLLTSVFLHIGVVHLLMNMWALLYIGSQVEQYLRPQVLVVLYVVFGLLASIASVGFNENIVSAGASGAIFGLYGLFLGLLVSKKLGTESSENKALITSMVIFIGYNLFYGFTKQGVDNAAHVGGLISGFLIAFVVARFFDDWRKQFKKILLLLAASVLIAFSMPSVIHDPITEYTKVLENFVENENKALWIYEIDTEELKKSPEVYSSKIQTEGIDLWNDNLDMLDSLHHIPTSLAPTVSKLKLYCQLRLDSYAELKKFIASNDFVAKEKHDVMLLEISQLIDSMQ